MSNAYKPEEYFYGVSLDKKDASVTWDVKSDEYENASDRLHIRQILLGHTAKEGEYNVVEVETMSLHAPVKIPIAVLKVGETRLVQPNLEFPDGPVTFTLVEGNGPVYIHGQQVPGKYFENVVDEEYLSDEECLEEEDEDVPEDENPSKKRKLPANNAKTNANSKPQANANKKK